MKKILLLLVAAVAYVATASADYVAFDFTTTDDDGKIYGYTPHSSSNGFNTYEADGSQITSGDVTLTMYKNGNNGWRFWNTGTAITMRLMKDASMVVSVPDGCTISEIAFTGSNLTRLTVDGTALTGSNSASWTGSATSVEFVKNETGSANLETMTVTYTSNGKDVAELSFPADSYKATCGSTFDAPIASSNSDGDITYSSNNTSVAEVDATTGEVTIVGIGTTVITATAAETDTYATNFASYTLTVKYAAELSFSQTSYTFALGKSDYLDLTSNSDGEITYSSSNTSVATVLAHYVRTVGVGTAVITATAAETDTYFAGSAACTLTVTKPEPTLSFPADSYTVALGDTFNAPTVSSNSDGDITYSSSDKSVATVDATTGAVTIVGIYGVANIIATAEETDTYAAGSAKYILSVKYAAGLSFPKASYTVAKDETFTAPSLTKVSDGTITYSSSNTSVATVDESTGEVTIVGVGTTVITATAAKTDTYAAGSAEYTLTVKSVAELSFSEASYTAALGDSFDSPNLTSNSDGDITYSSSETSVAEVDATTGAVTIVGIGTTVITATAAETDTYFAGSAEYTLSVKYAAGLSFSEASHTVAKDETFTAPTLTKVSDGTITYSSSNTSVAEVDATTGEVTIVGIGTTVITATAAETDTYAAGSAEYTLIVTKCAAKLSFSATSYKVAINETFTAPTLQKATDGDITYSSSNTSVAEVNATTGEVTIAAIGTTVITATVPETDTYFAGSAEYTLIVTDVNVTGTKATSMKAGKYFICYNNQVVMPITSTDTSGCWYVEDVTSSTDETVTSPQTNIFEFEASGDYYTIKDTYGRYHYIIDDNYNDTDDYNSFQLSTTLDSTNDRTLKKYRWSVSIDSNGNATIENLYEYTIAYYLYNNSIIEFIPRYSNVSPVPVLYLIESDNSGGSTAIDAISVDVDDAVYYNMQGVKVANPASGSICIKVQGGKASKILVK